MLEIFTFLTNLLYGNLFLVMISSFLWGVASVLLSPCHLSSIPLIIGFINKQKNVTIKRAFGLSLLFALGILLTILIIGFLTGISGRMLGDLGIWGYFFLSGFFIVFGLILLEIIKLPDFASANISKFTEKGLISAFLIGLVFGIGLGPCTFAFMAPMLGFVFQVSTNNFIYGILLLLIFSIGHISVIVLAGTFVELVEKYLRWSESAKSVKMIRRICGVLVIIAGIYNLFKIF